MNTITNTELNLPLLHRGKVRDVYSFGENILLVATDRVSAFDVVFNEGVPHKGEVLNMLSAFWFNKTRNIIDNHMLTTEIPDELPHYLKGRSMIVKKAIPIKIEMIVRGYLTGSGLRDYQNTGRICGIELPSGLKNGSRLPAPILTPSTKAEKGHDVNITLNEASKIVGAETAAYIRDKAIELYRFGHSYLWEKWFVLADTKFEFGIFNDEIILIDECMTPDSSRYWDRAEYEKGNLISSDKQYLRDYLETLGWDKRPPPPALSREIVDELSRRYLDAYFRITGHKLTITPATT